MMKQIFEKYEDLKVICLVFKELLSVYNMNRPFTGGMSSMNLVAMTHNIMKMRGKQIKGDYIQFIEDLCQFVTQKFVPFKTLISASNEHKAKVNPQFEMNIEDPKDGSLMDTTNIRQTKEIIQLFSQFKKTLRKIREEW